MQPVLVVVHPGSACGSADYNLEDGAEEAREGLIQDLKDWTGSVIVIDGSLSSELPRYRELNRALTDALGRAERSGFISHRQWGCDDVPPHQTDAVKTVIRKFGLAKTKHDIAVTGCWFDPSDRAGCVNDVRKAFEKAGFQPRVLPGAVVAPPEEDDEDAPSLGAAP